MSILKKACNIMALTTNVSIALIDEDGFPSCSTVSIIKTDGIHTAWFATGLDTPKVKRIGKNNKASVCFCDGENNVTLVGTIEILVDDEIKSSLWQDWFINHFQQGPTDPNYCTLKFTTNRLSLWIDGEGADVRFATGTPQSRCGLLCNSCTFREPCNCGGCIETNGHPFHGECPVAICVQGKGLTHCGECSDMPCELLNQYSCNAEHGDKPHGLRIEQCKNWANAKSLLQGEYHGFHHSK